MVIIPTDSSLATGVKLRDMECSTESRAVANMARKAMAANAAIHSSLRRAASTKVTLAIRMMVRIAPGPRTNTTGKSRVASSPAAVSASMNAIRAYQRLHSGGVDLRPPCSTDARDRVEELGAGRMIDVVPLQ